MLACTIKYISFKIKSRSSVSTTEHLSLACREDACTRGEEGCCSDPPTSSARLGVKRFIHHTALLTLTAAAAGRDVSHAPVMRYAQATCFFEHLHPSEIGALIKCLQVGHWMGLYHTFQVRASKASLIIVAFVSNDLPHLSDVFLPAQMCNGNTCTRCKCGWSA